MEDAWLKMLQLKDLIVRHVGWIVDSVEEGFLVPCSNYILDEYFDAQKLNCLDDPVDETDADITRISDLNTSGETTLCLANHTCEDIHTGTVPIQVVRHPDPSGPRLTRKLSFDYDRQQAVEPLAKRQSTPPTTSLAVLPTPPREKITKTTPLERFIKVIDTNIEPSTDPLPTIHPFDLPDVSAEQKLLSCPPRLALPLLLSLPEVESTLFRPSSEYKGKEMWCATKEG
ncbi:hypothetical protein PQX77_010572 [Marasmius sp. AFHP31]|nr:hypothetical protein PQX77_010572 [Marasmius sp. AFHP31]